MWEVKTHREYDKFYNKWTQLKACLEGEEEVKKAREKYLPYPVRVDDEDKTSDEYQAMYDLYLEGAHFMEFTSEAVEDLVSSAFRRPLEVTKADFAKTELPEELQYLDLEDIAKEIVGMVGGYGRCFALTDYPRIETTPSLFEDEKNKAYISLYNPLDVLNWIETKRSGNPELVYVLLREIDEVRIAESEFDEVPTYMYRELLMNENNEFIIKIHREDKPTEVIIPRAGGKPFNAIPGIFIGTTSNTTKVDKSPVIGISNSNIKHYQTWAELFNIQTYAGHPQLVLSGLAPGWNQQAQNKKLKLKLDAATVLALEGDSSKADLLELRSTDVIHFKTLDTLERGMLEQGARLKSISNKAGVESAQALKIRTASSMSKLASIVNNTEEAMSKLLKWAAQYMVVGLEDIRVNINKEFYAPEPDGGLLTSISNAEAVGTAPRGTALNYLKQIELADEKISNEEYLKNMQLQIMNPNQPRQPQVNNTRQKDK